MAYFLNNIGGLAIPKAALTALLAVGGAWLLSGSGMAKKAAACAGIIAKGAIALKDHFQASGLKQKREFLKDYLPEEEAQKIEKYIETNLPEWKGGKKDVFVQRTTNRSIPRSIHYDAAADVTYVHLNRKGAGDRFLGIGTSKTVTQTMNYNTGIVHSRAVTSSTSSLKNENDAIELLKDTRGIIRTYAIHQYESAKKNQYKSRHKIAYIQEKMDGDLTREDIHFTLAQKNDIARDVLEGLRNMHRENIYHNDIHEGNILVSIDLKTQRARAVITDFGEASRGRNLFPALDDRRLLGTCLKKLYSDEASPELNQLFAEMNEKKITSEEAFARFCEISPT